MHLRDLILSAALFILSVALFVTSWRRVDENADLQANGQAAKGTVENLKQVDHKRNGQHTSYSYEAEVLYYETNGTGHRVWMPISTELAQTMIINGGPQYKVGASVPVVYRPTQPDFARIAGYEDTSSSGILTFVFGVMCLGSLSWFFLSYSKGRPPSVSDQPAYWRTIR